MWPSEADPDFGSFVAQVCRELEAQGNELEVVAIDRRDVEGTDMRVKSGVRAHVDRGHRRAGTREQSLGDLGLVAAERQHRPAVVGIRVDVEQPQRAEGARQALDRRAITPFADVRDGQEHGLSLPYAAP